MSRPRRHEAIIAVVGLLMFVPYGLAGPSFFTDDWFSLRNGEFDGWWMSAGSHQWRARPIGSSVYAVTFGLIGQRPMIHYALAAVVVIFSALLIHRIARDFLPSMAAWALALTWLLLPNHTSLEMWPSALNIGVALLLLLIGVRLLTRTPSSAKDPVVAAVAFAIGTLAYEAVAPAAVVAAFIVAWPHGKAGWRVAVPTAAAVGLAGTWMLLNWHPDKQGLDQSLDVSLVVPGHFGESVVGLARPVQAAVIGAVLGATLLTASRLIPDDRRPTAGWPEWLIASGWGVIVVGVLPFIRYFYAALGFGDRVTVVSGLGGAMVLVGAIVVLGRAWRPVGVVVGVVLVSAGLAQRASMVSDYATAADDSQRIRSAVLQRWPDPPNHPIQFGPEPIVKRHIAAFFDVGSAVSLLYGEPSVDARMAFDPEVFHDAPEEFRVDLRPLSELDDGRLVQPTNP